jgi:hypothetical protein
MSFLKIKNIKNSNLIVISRNNKLLQVYFPMSKIKKYKLANESLSHFRKDNNCKNTSPINKKIVQKTINRMIILKHTEKEKSNIINNCNNRINILKRESNNYSID